MCKKIIELLSNKTSNVAYVPIKDSDQLMHLRILIVPQSDKSLLCIHLKAKALSFLCVGRQESNQTEWMSKLILSYRCGYRHIVSCIVMGLT